MEKKIIVITGASGGLGTQLARLLASPENTLILLGFTGEQYVLPTEHHWKTADLRDPRQIEEVFSKVIAEFGRIDVLINNAGISRNGMSWKLPLDTWNEVIEINLTAPFLTIKATLPSMRENGFGRIINISSVVAQTGVVGTSAYAASKAGLIGLTKTISKEVATNGITVNVISLGYFDQGMIHEVSDDMQTAIIQQIPKKRLGSVETLAGTIQWLVSKEADYVTGQTISLNGGLFS